MKPVIYIASSNAHKIAEFSQMFLNAGLDFEIRSCSEIPDWKSPPENGNTFCENAFIKAEALFQKVPPGAYVMADDSDISVDALGGAPGVMSARYAGENGPDADAKNNEKLLRELEGVPDHKRSARFICSIALITPEGERKNFEAKFEGQINRKAAGLRGFGYDPLFYLPERGMTSAELSAEEKNSISHRGKAFAMLAEFLKQKNNQH